LSGAVEERAAAATPCGTVVDGVEWLEAGVLVIGAGACGFTAALAAKAAGADVAVDFTVVDAAPATSATVPVAFERPSNSSRTSTRMPAAEMARRLGFTREAERLNRVWDTLYRPAGQPHRLPQRLLASSNQLIPEVVDEIAFQTRRNLAHRSLIDIMPFRPQDEAAIKAGARQLALGRVPDDLPPRQLVSAASYALAEGHVQPHRLSRQVIEHLNSIRAGPVERPRRLAA